MRKLELLLMSLVLFLTGCTPQPPQEPVTDDGTLQYGEGANDYSPYDCDILVGLASIRTSGIMLRCKPGTQ